ADLSAPNVYGNSTTTNNAASPWTIVSGRNTVAPADIRVISAANVADVDISIGGSTAAQRVFANQGVVLATVRQNGPRTNSLTGQPDITLYGNVEAPSPSGFGT